MTHYQKIAAMIFRTIGVLVIIASLILWLSVAVVAFSFPQRSFFSFIFVPYLLYLIAGMILFAASRPLAKWICFDFDKFNDQ